MVATGVGRSKDDDDIDEVDTDKTSPQLAITKVRKRIFDDEVNAKDEEKDNEEDSDRGGSWMNEKRRKDNEIATLKRKIKTFEMMIKEMQSTSRMSGRDKTGWTGEELIFVKDINDFCRDRIYPKEKFLRKNWQEYLPNDRGSLYSVCMKHLSIPEGLNPREIWGRVIVPSIRDKFQSMKCNMNNKINLQKHYLLLHVLTVIVAMIDI
jgi:hypothetical protein